MAFCIECGVKSPAKAKFCAACGTPMAVVEAKPPAETKADTPTKKPKKKAKPVKVEAVKAAPIQPDPIKSEPIKVETPKTEPPNVQIPAAPSPAVLTVEPAAKSRAGLWAGLAALLLIGGGAGAYAAGLLEPLGIVGKAAPTETVATAPAPNPDTLAPITEADTSEVSPEITAYRDAIKSGRISVLGQFAADFADSTRAKDAQEAAFASLARQNSVAAFLAFTKYFPEADVSAYAGPRTNADTGPEFGLPGDNTGYEVDFFEPEDVAISAPVIATPAPIANPTPVPAYEIPTIRPSISTKTAELDDFVAQGSVDYVVSVVDDMLALPDLNSEEATYLSNYRNRAELSRREIVAVITPEIVPEVTPEAAHDPAPETTPESAPETTQEPITEAPFDTPAKPIERYGAITPDGATEPGECEMRFDIDTTGTPTNISASCTDPIFIAPGEEAVAEWLYEPALKNGAAVTQTGLVVTLRFHLEDPDDL